MESNALKFRNEVVNGEKQKKITKWEKRSHIITNDLDK